MTQDQNWKYIGKLAASVALSAVIGFFWISNHKKKGLISKPNAEFTIGQSLKSEFTKKRALVLFWASWCQSCKSDLKYFNLLKISQEDLVKDYDLIAINLDSNEDQPKAHQMWSDLKLKYIKPIFKNPSFYQEEFSIDVLPTYFIFENSGKVVLRVDGQVSWEDHKLLSLLKI